MHSRRNSDSLSCSFFSAWLRVMYMTALPLVPCSMGGGEWGGGGCEGEGSAVGGPGARSPGGSRRRAAGIRRRPMLCLAAPPPALRLRS